MNLSQDQISARERVETSPAAPALAGFSIMEAVVWLTLC